MKYIILIFCLLEISTQTIFDTSECQVYLPSSIGGGSSSPEDDIFKIKTNCELEYSKTMIFNRWGNIVFKEENTNEGFDGAYEGRRLPDGTYFYSVTYLLNNEVDTTTLQGYLQLYN